MALVVALLGGAGFLWSLVTRSSGSSVSADTPGTPTLLDADAPAEPALLDDDERAAELAWDPNRQTDWSYESNGQKVVYLTFDDGPSENTEGVLDILDQYGINATFFVTGNDPDYRDSIRDAYERGNTIGMHTMTHDYKTVYASEDAYFSDLDQVAQVVKDEIGYVPYLVRFPGGSSNTVSANYSSGLMTALSEDVPARGYQYYDWNVSSGDAAGNNVAVDTIVDSSCVEGYSNIMLLCHDSNTKATTVEALPRIIQYYLDNGYAFAPIDRSTYVVHHRVGN